MKSYIAAIGTANPGRPGSQEKAADFMISALNMEGARGDRLRKLYQSTGIQERYSVIEDFHRTRGEFEFFPNTDGMEPMPGVSRRMEVFRSAGLKLALIAAENCLRHSNLTDRHAITHLITVSCTGMSAPGLDIELVDTLQLAPGVHRTAINFMGCYAAFNAIKVADACCKANPTARVLVVCVELCTIHFQKHRSLDQIFANALFGDGAAAILVQAEPGPGFALAPIAFHCDLIRAGKEEMAWSITEAGFEMILTAYVPKLIRLGIGEMAIRLLAQLGLALAEIDYFAIHPGGRKILEACEEALGISREDNRFSYRVLEAYGNMSSPTVLFVLNEILGQLTGRDAGGKILSFAFGPGLTLESMLLEIHHV
ncbi:MAG: type III polyketide synthase [Candidatus Competibacteraceae bacterium]